MKIELEIKDKDLADILINLLTKEIRYLNGYVETKQDAADLKEIREQIRNQYT